MATSHKRETARRRPRAAAIAAPVAVVVTGLVVTAGVLGSAPQHSPNIFTMDIADAAGSSAHDVRHLDPVSRGSERVDEPEMSKVDKAMTPQAVRRAVSQADTKLWTTTDLNLWTSPSEVAERVGEIKSEKLVLVTGRKLDGRDEIVLDGRSRWVTAGYLSKDKPDPDPATMGLDFSPCGDMSVTNGLVPDMVRAYEAVCNAFPGQVSTYGGLGAREEHNTGHAVDAMVYGDSALGQRIADFLQAHAAELNLYDIIWQQHIWTPVRSAEGWRLMPDRGSATANHFDHVHFAVN